MTHSQIAAYIGLILTFGLMALFPGVPGPVIGFVAMAIFAAGNLAFQNYEESLAERVHKLEIEKFGFNNEIGHLKLQIKEQSEQIKPLKDKMEGIQIAKGFGR